MNRKRRFTDEQLLERKRQCTRQWRQKSKEKIIGYRRKYYQENREAILAKAKKKAASYYKKNKEKVKNNVKRWRENNPGKTKELQIRRKYGLSMQEYSNLIEKQQFQCAACGIGLKDLPGSEIQIDHCHNTGNIRGILCGRCNRALGLLNDDPIKTQKLADYIKKYA